jgi:hypothetical protein
LNDTLVCECPDQFELDNTTNTCKLKSICGEGGYCRADCQNRNALCVYADNNQGYDCFCPRGLENLNNTCVDVCDYYDQVSMSTRNNLCKEKRAKCNPFLIINGKLSGDGLPLNDFCECGPGSDGDLYNQSCMIKVFVAQFNIFIKNTGFEDNPTVEGLDPTLINDDYYYDFEGFAGDVNSMVAENLQISNQTEQAFKGQQFIGILKDRLRLVLGMPSWLWSKFELKDCLLEDNYYNCLIAVYLSKELNPSDGNISSKLSNLCEDPEEEKVCIFLSPNKAQYYAMRDTGPVITYVVIDGEKLDSTDTQLQIYSVCL